MMLSDVCLSVAYIGPKWRTQRPRKTKIGTEVATSHVTRTPITRSKGQKSRSLGRFAYRRVGASGSCSGVRGNVLSVGNCCYVPVCSAAQGASARTGEERGGCISRRPPAYSLLHLRVHWAATTCLFVMALVIWNSSGWLFKSSLAGDGGDHTVCTACWIIVFHARCPTTFCYVRLLHF